MLCTSSDINRRIHLKRRHFLYRHALILQRPILFKTLLTRLRRIQKIPHINTPTLHFLLQLPHFPLQLRNSQLTVKNLRLMFSPLKFMLCGEHIDVFLEVGGGG